MGKTAAVVQDAACQHLLDIAAQADSNEGIRQGLHDIAKKRFRPVREFFRDFEAEHTETLSSPRVSPRDR
jgi:hypothetical protein